VPVLCPSHRGLPARPRSSPAWELGGGERSHHRQHRVTSVFAVLPPLFQQKSGPGSPAGSGATCAGGRNGSVSRRSRTMGRSSMMARSSSHPVFMALAAPQSRCQPGHIPRLPCCPGSRCGSGLRVLQTSLCPGRSPDPEPGG